jgi:hypothetical protein
MFYRVNEDYQNRGKVTIGVSQNSTPPLYQFVIFRDLNGAAPPLVNEDLASPKISFEVLSDI